MSTKLAGFEYRVSSFADTGSDDINGRETFHCNQETQLAGAT